VFLKTPGPLGDGRDITSTFFWQVERGDPQRLYFSPSEGVPASRLDRFPPFFFSTHPFLGPEDSNGLTLAVARLLIKIASFIRLVPRGLPPLWTLFPPLFSFHVRVKRIWYSKTERISIKTPCC